MPYFFVSYTHSDYERALELAHSLKDSSGMDYWIDESGVKSWYRFIEVIVEAIENCSALVLVMSKNILRSKYVKLEVSYALMKGKRVIPVSIDGQPIHFDTKPCSELGDCMSMDETSHILRLVADGKLRGYIPDKAPDSAVDLGLSVKWARMNIGASTPSQIGTLFLWDYFTGNKVEELKRIPPDEGIKYSFSDGKTRLDHDDDIATRLLMGHWRMPGRKEFQELKDKCNWIWEEGKGFHVVSKSNGASLFLPLANPAKGLYWSNELVLSHSGFFFDYPIDSKAYALSFSDSSIHIKPEYRTEHLAVRPVWDPSGPGPIPHGASFYNHIPLHLDASKITVLFTWEDFSQGGQIMEAVEEATGIKPGIHVGTWRSVFGSKDETESVDNSDLVFILLSEKAMKMDWTQTAIRYISQREKNLIVIRLDFCELSEWAKFELGSTPIVDFHSDKQMDDLLGQLKAIAKREK